ncbi:Farnesoic acid O-methyl transferase [Phytophthora cactorum]|nr:Farnesoic acid O-methyl transferase [Phytophthora cactorum]
MEDASNEPPVSSLCALVVQFEATAREDLRVGFAPSVEVSNDESEDAERRKKPHTEWKYEVAVGTSGNTELVWRKSGSGRTTEVDLARVFTGRTCSAQDFVAYWVVVDVKSGSLSFGVGAQVGQDVLSTVQDPDFVRVTQTAFTSWDSPVSIRGIQVHGVYEGQTEALAAANVSAFPPPRPMVRADPLGNQDLLTPEQRQQYEAEYAASKRRSERFGAPFAPPDIKKFLDPREVRKLQRTGAIVPGFSTGIDITSQEEQSKREQRMKRFDTPQFAVERSCGLARRSSDSQLRTIVTSGPTGLKPASAKVRRERCDVKAPAAEGQPVVFRDDAVHMYSLDEKFQQVQRSLHWARRSHRRLKQKKEKKTEDANASGEDVDMADAEASADNDSAMALEDVEEEVEVPDVEFNRSSGICRRRNDRDYGSSSRRRSGGSRAHPYGEFREDRRGEEPSGRRRRSKNDDRDTGKPSKRIRVNADGSINIVRDEKAAPPAASSEPAGESKPADVPKSEPAPAVE